jgi:NAD(P)-dependent dehydrogenase (short-subunit alcohol dehydrogenase family)
MRLDGKVAIVTGGAHGMGEAEARLFAKERAKVVVADILGDQAESVAASIRASNGHRRRGLVAMPARLAHVRLACGQSDGAIRRAALRDRSSRTEKRSNSA